LAGKKPATPPGQKSIVDDAPEVPVNTLNEFAIGAGQNMENSTHAMNGRAHFVRQGMPTVPTFRTKQEAFRYAAYLVTLAEVKLPDEDGEHTYEQVLHAIRNV
jgi:hypothetical protein